MSEEYKNHPFYKPFVKMIMSIVIVIITGNAKIIVKPFFIEIS